MMRQVQDGLSAVGQIGKLFVWALSTPKVPSEAALVATDAKLSLKAPVSLSKLLGESTFKDFNLAQGEVRISKDGDTFCVVLNRPLSATSEVVSHNVDVYDKTSHFKHGLSELWEQTPGSRDVKYQVSRSPHGPDRLKRETPAIDLSGLLALP